MVKRVSDSGCPKTRKSAGKRPAVLSADRPVEGTVQARLAEFGCDPFAILAGIATDGSADTRLRLTAAKELAAYLMTKPRQAKADPVANVDVAGIIAGTWRRPPKGKKAAAKSAVDRGAPTKAKPRAAR